MKIALFDVDGVLTLPEEVFSVVYARSHGLDPEPFEQFFRSDWQPIVTGKADLKESIAANPGLWQWEGEVDDLLKYWFETEDVRNEELIKVIGQLKTHNIPCYLATEQEKYRGDYMRNVMFKDLFDGYYITAELGVSKTEPNFYQAIIDDLKRKHTGIEADDIVFFDDSQSKVDTACLVGIDGQLYTNVEQVRDLLSNSTDDPVKKILGKSAEDIFAMDTSSHAEFHSTNAFCGNAGPEELNHLQKLLDNLTDNELARLTDQVGITFGSPSNEVDREVLEGVIDEADREVFYREYYAVLVLRK